MKRFFIVLLVCSMGISFASAQDTTAEIEVSEALLTELEGIEEYVTEVRGLDLLNPVTRIFPTRVDVETYLQESIDMQLTPELVEQSLSFYYAFDFIDDPEIDIVDIYLTLVEDQIGGYYDPVDKTLNTILISGEELGDELPLLEKIIYAHEFVHTLQDQHYDLAALGFTLDTDPTEVEADLFIARQALVEGDATFVMNIYTETLIAENPLAALGLISSSFTSGSMTIPPGTPDILTRELFFPYNSGLTFVTALVADGGYEAVDAAFDDLPQSSEQILHPQKYIDGEMPLTVTLADTSSALGDGWTMTDEATLGEFYLRAYLDTYIEDRDVWVTAGSGWGGDRYQLFINESGERAMLLRIAWDTSQDSTEFAEAYTLWGDTRFESTATDGCWSAFGDAICFTTLSSGDSVIVRAPSIEQAQALIATQ